jgi:peptidyl-Lys metalloendopeptidase
MQYLPAFLALVTSVIGLPSSILESALVKRTSFVGCSASQQVIIINAITQAELYATHAVKELQAYSATNLSVLENAWFGNLTASRRTTLIRAYTMLETAPSNWSYDCNE